MMADYFVDVALGKDSNTGTDPEHAWSSIDKVNDTTLASGDTVYFRRGQIHSGTINASDDGATGAGNGITYDSYGSGMAYNFAIISNADFDTGNQPTCIDINASYINIQNLSIRNARYAGIQGFEDQDNITITNCDFVNNGWGIRLKGSDYTIDGCYFNSNIMTDDDGTSNDNGGGGISIEALDADSADNIIISNCTFIDCVAKSAQFGVDGGAIELFRDSSGTRIYNNYFRGCKGVMEMGGTALTQTIDDLDFYNNVIENCYGRWVFVNDRTGSFKVELADIRFLYNTYVETELSNTALFFDGTWSSISSKFSLIGNVVYGLSSVTNQSGITHNNNAFYRVGGGALGLTAGGTETSTDPTFVDIDAGDFRLDTGSPALGAGVTVSGYTADANGNSLQSPPDVGAIQSITAAKNSGDVLYQSATLVPYNNISTDVYPLAKSEHIKGTLKSVPSMWALHTLPAVLREAGMVAYVENIGHFYLSDNLKTWFPLVPDHTSTDGLGGVLWIQHRETTGTNSGSGTSDTDSAGFINTRPINLVRVNTIPGAQVDLTGNDFKLPPGLYDVDVSMTFSKTDEVFGWMRDKTNSVTLVEGLTGWSATDAEQNGVYYIRGIAQIEDDIDIDIVCIYEDNNVTAGYTYGRPADRTNQPYEVYLTAVFKKIG